MAKKLAKFDSNKHPRGRGGRFIETPDQPKLSKQEIGRARIYGTESGSRGRISGKKPSPPSEAEAAKPKPSNDILKRARVYGTDNDARKLVLDRMSKAQLQRLYKAVTDAEARKKAEAKPEPAPEASPKPKRSRLTPEEKAAKEAAKAAEKAKKQAEAEAEAKAKKEQAKKEAEALAKKQEELAEIEAEREKLQADRASRKANNDEYKDFYDEVKANTKAGIKSRLDAGVKEKDAFKVSIKRDPTDRPPAQKDSLDLTDKGIDIWRNKPEFGKFDAGFKVRENKNFEYSVDHDGQKLTLNKSKKVYEYGGETVEGIPDTHHNLRDLKSQQLFDRLADAMRHTENSRKGVVAPAPEWKSSIHGSIDKKYVRSRKGVGVYGEMQIHHVDQWAQQRFDEITSKLKYNEKTKKFEDGEITVDQAQARMKQLLIRVEKTDEDGKTSVEYMISPKAQKDRRLVVLAAGTHDINSPLFAANHPKGIHPETGKLTQFGIPEEGEDGRTGFNHWRAGFWAQHHRREAYVFQQEINRRIKKGDISPEEAKTLWDTAHKKVVDNHQHVLKLRERRAVERKAVKDAKEELKKERGIK